jgi:hypothetical protein
MIYNSPFDIDMLFINSLPLSPLTIGHCWSLLVTSLLSCFTLMHYRHPTISLYISSLIFPFAAISPLLLSPTFAGTEIAQSEFETR